jgi:peptide/nickel transport system ATP-binding protein
MKPDIILADEPTSALDNIVALETMKMLIELLDNFAILLITHDSDLANWCSDKIINIEDL